MVRPARCHTAVIPESDPASSSQAYISRARIESFSLIADLNYISQNAPRICRALFEICLRKGWYVVADQLLTFSKVGFSLCWSLGKQQYVGGLEMLLQCS